MTKLPPGFTHELPQHLQQHNHGVFDEQKEVPVLDFDRFCCGEFIWFNLVCRSYGTTQYWRTARLGAHGFSALIVSSTTAIVAR